MAGKSLVESTELDALILYAKGELSEANLNENQLEIFNRLDFCDNLIRQHGRRSDVVAIMVNKFNYTKRQAYRDYQDTQLLFGSVNKFEKQYWKTWSAEILKEAIIEARKSFNDTKNRIKSLEAIAKLCKELRETLGYSNEDVEMPDFSKIQPQHIIIGFYPELMNVELPEDLDDQLDKLVKSKLKINLDDIDEAQVISE